MLRQLLCKEPTKLVPGPPLPPSFILSARPLFGRRQTGKGGFRSGLRLGIVNDERDGVESDGGKGHGMERDKTGEDFGGMREFEARSDEDKEGGGSGPA